MKGFWEHLGNFFGRLGEETVYQILVMFYCLSEDSVPGKVKAAIVSALGYFILPIDAIPDLMPGLGLTDDITMLASAYLAAQVYATPEVRQKAQEKTNEIFRKNKVIESK